MIGEKIKEELCREVIFENEIFSTKEVEKTGAAPLHMRDASAAALILQRFLNIYNLSMAWLR